MLTKELCRNVANICVLRAYNAAKCCPNPAGEYTVLPQTLDLAGFKGGQGGKGKRDASRRKEKGCYVDSGLKLLPNRLNRKLICGGGVEP